MLRKMDIRDKKIAEELIGRINRSAGQIFTEAQKDEIKEGLIYDFCDSKGAFTIIEKKDYIVSQIAFEEDTKNDKVLKEMQKALEKVIDKKGKKDLFLNIYGKNPSIIEYFGQCGFKKDMSGIQYKYKIKEESFQKHINGLNIEFRGYEDEMNDQYIELLDEAFKPLHIACNIEPNAWRRDKENVINWFKEVNEKDEFGALWHDNQLASLYVVYNEYIHTLATSPKYQGKGFGSNLLNICISKMCERGYNEIYLNCIDENTQAHKFYTRNGFEAIGWFCENTYRS